MTKQSAQLQVGGGDVDPPRLTKQDTTNLWHAVEAFKDMVRAMRDMEGITPEQLASEEARLSAARRALAKVNAIRRAQP